MTTPRTGWCTQHKQPRSACLPGDRHVQSMRASDELMDAVAARAAGMGLSRQDGIEMALEEFAGWHEPGEPWNGPRQWTAPERAATLAGRVRPPSARQRPAPAAPDRDAARAVRFLPGPEMPPDLDEPDDAPVPDHNRERRQARR